MDHSKESLNSMCCDAIKVCSEKATQAELERILEVAIRSPSCMNRQAWSFSWNEEILQVYYDQRRCEHDVYTQNESPLISLGCLIESIVICAEDIGWRALPEVIDYSLKSDVVALVTFDRITDNAISSDPAGKVTPHMIIARATDRRKYQGGVLGDELKNLLLKTGSEFSPVKIHFSKTTNASLNSFIARADQFIWQDKGGHRSTMRWLRFSLGSDNVTDGIHWRELGVTNFEFRLLFVMRLFFIQKLLNFIFLRIFYRKIVSLLSSSAEICCISAPPHDRAALFSLGRYWLRVWCILNARGFAVQPHMHPTSLIQEFRSGEYNFSEKWREIFISGEKCLNDAFGLQSNQVPIALFRTGINDQKPQNSLSKRRPIKDIFSISK